MRRAERKEGEKRKRGIKKRDLNRRIGRMRRRRVKEWMREVTGQISPRCNLA